MIAQSNIAWIEKFSMSLRDVQQKQFESSSNAEKPSPREQKQALYFMN